VSNPSTLQVACFADIVIDGFADWAITFSQPTA
jgi:hypothetical protein